MNLRLHFYLGAQVISCTFLSTFHGYENVSQKQPHASGENPNYLRAIHLSINYSYTSITVKFMTTKTNRYISYAKDFVSFVFTI